MIKRFRIRDTINDTINTISHTEHGEAIVDAFENYGFKDDINKIMIYNDCCIGFMCNAPSIALCGDEETGFYDIVNLDHYCEEQKLELIQAIVSYLKSKNVFVRLFLTEEQQVLNTCLEKQYLDMY